MKTLARLLVALALWLALPVSASAAIALDASSPLRFTNTWNVTSGGSITSAAFTAPTDAFLVLCATVDTKDATGSPPNGALSVSDTGSLTWTKQVERTGAETTVGGHSAIFTARTTSAVSRTVSLVAGSGVIGTWGTGWASAKLYVFTGVDVNGTSVDTITANNEGGSITTPLTTTSLTPGSNGVLVSATLDWQAKGTITSSDMTGGSGPDHAENPGTLDVASGFKTCTSGVGVTAGWTAGAAGPQWKWTQIIVREAGGAVTPGCKNGLLLLGVGCDEAP